MRRYMFGLTVRREKPLGDVPRVFTEAAFELADSPGRRSWLK